MINECPSGSPSRLGFPQPLQLRQGTCGVGRMTAVNSTGDLHAPGPQLSVTDIIVITVYFALNVAVGIWVRGPAR